MSDVATTVKKTRTRKTASTVEQALTDASLSSKALKPMDDAFAKLTATIEVSRGEYETLQKQILEVKETWDKEQRNHKVQIAEINQQEEVERKREKETYDYEASLARKKAEDEFEERKNKWEKELSARKEDIAEEKQELEMLRKQAAGFEAEKEKAIKEACVLLQKQLQETFATEKKLREQEVKSEQELLALKIANLTSENTRLVNEVVMLKKSLEEATRQLKDVAVKVIESSSNKPQANPTQEL